MNEETTALDELADPLGPMSFEEEEEPAAIPLPKEPPFRIPSGKYKGLVLPRMLGVKPSMAAKVDALKQQIIADPDFKQHAQTLSLTYAEIRREAEAKAAELAEIKLRLAAVMQLMVDQFEVEGMKAVSHHDGAVIRVQPEPHLIVLDKPRFRLACIEDGLEALMSLPWATANKLMKERALEGLEPYEGAQLYMRPKVLFSDPTKVKP